MTSRLPLHVLLIEDNAPLRRLMEQTLADAGLRVTGASCADQALLALSSGPQADILLCDIRMPGCLDGLELCRWVERMYPRTTIMLQTGFPGLNTGHFRVLQKPFSPDELVAYVREGLDPISLERWHRSSLKMVAQREI
jgi:DNA-binding NtrC family response regulator